MIFEITNQWTVVGATLGATVNAQNLGRAGDLIEIITGDTQPLETQRGYALAQLNKTYRISGYDGLIWARYIRYDLNGTNKPADARVCLLNVQEGAVITEVSDVPSQLVTGGEITKSSRLKVSTTTRTEYQIVKGDYYGGESKRLGIGIDETYYAVIKAPPDKFLSIEDVEIAPDFADAGTGKFNIAIDAFVDISNANTWTYTGGTALPAGKPLNAALVNNLNTAIITIGVNATLTPTVPGFGVDYPLIAIDHAIESQGARESLSLTGVNFFRNNRFVLLAPNQELLVRTTTEGTSTGTIDLDTRFFLSTIDIEQLQ